MDENLKNIKKQLLSYSTKKFFNNELCNVEGNTLGEIIENYTNKIKEKEKNESYLSLINTILNKKYAKDSNGNFYHFKSYNNKLLKVDKINIINNKYNLSDYDFDDDFNEIGVEYFINQNILIRSEDKLYDLLNFETITIDEYENKLFNLNQINQIRLDISSKNNKINESIKTVKFLGNSYRLCDYTKNMTREEYFELIEKIDNETKKDLNEYINYLKSKYVGKYVYFIEDEYKLVIFKIENIRFNDVFYAETSASYTIQSNGSIIKIITKDTSVRFDKIVDIIDENVINELETYIK